MGRRCVVKDCKKYKLGSTSHHRFPNQPNLAQQWAFNIQTLNKQEAFDYNVNTFVCGSHFSVENKIALQGKNYLKTDAVPTIFEESRDECNPNGVDYIDMKLFKQTYRNKPITHNSTSLTSSRTNSETNKSTDDSLTIVKCESLNQDMYETNGSNGDYWTESSSPTEMNGKTYNSQQTIVSDTTQSARRTDSSSKNQMYKCEQCGHMNKILPASTDGFFDSSQSIDTSQTTVFQVSIHPQSLQISNDPLSSQSNRISTVNQNLLLNGNGVNAANNELFCEISDTSAKQMKKKRVCFPGDVRDDDELAEESAQKYISVLRKSVMDHRTEKKTLLQQNRRYRKRIATLKTLLKDLVEKTKKGHYVIEA